MIGLELLSEKSLWQIYRRCLRWLKPSYFNLLATLAVTGALIGDCIMFPGNSVQRIYLIRALGDTGVGLGTTVLGFLIAGFTIFATLSRPELFLRLHQTRYRNTDLSYLQVNFFTFVEVFVVYIFLVITCLVLKLFASAGGLAVSLIKFYELNPVCGYAPNRLVIVSVIYVFFGSLVFYSLLALKSFIFNTYHTVMTSVVWSINPPPNHSD